MKRLHGNYAAAPTGMISVRDGAFSVICDKDLKVSLPNLGDRLQDSYE